MTIAISKLVFWDSTGPGAAAVLSLAAGIFGLRPIAAYGGRR
jgi:hypothetical protein